MRKYIKINSNYTITDYINKDKQDNNEDSDDDGERMSMYADMINSND